MFLLVEWIDEPKTYSVVPVEDLVDGTLRDKCAELKGQIANINFGKKAYRGMILEIGK